jgi:hypothetical protein
MFMTRVALAGVARVKRSDFVRVELAYGSSVSSMQVTAASVFKGSGVKNIFNETER